MQLEKESQFSTGFYQHIRKRNHVGTSSVHSLILRLRRIAMGVLICYLDFWVVFFPLTYGPIMAGVLIFKLKYIFAGFQKLRHLKKYTHTTTV